jgi:hypothetical protein
MKINFSPPLTVPAGARLHGEIALDCCQLGTAPESARQATANRLRSMARRRNRRFPRPACLACRCRQLTTQEDVMAKKAKKAKKAAKKTAKKGKKK